MDALTLNENDIEVVAETALAVAQATISGAMKEAELSKADLARQMNRPASYITKMLRGDHNLTVKTLARALAACGFEIDLKRTRLAWGWTNNPAKTVTLTATAPRATEEQSLPSFPVAA